MEMAGQKPDLAEDAAPPELIARRAVRAAYFGFFVDMFEPPSLCTEGYPHLSANHLFTKPL